MNECVNQWTGVKQKKKEKQVANLNKVMRALKFRKNHKSKESAKGKTADVNTI